MYKKSIDYDKCNACMLCERICKNSRVIAVNADGLPEFRNRFLCISCGHCLAICPQRAISFELRHPEEHSGKYYAEPLKLDTARKPPDEEEMLEFLCSTRSSRYFLDKAVEKDKIRKVLDAMVRASSAGNEQNRNFYILDDKARLNDLESMIDGHYKKAMKAYANPFVSHALAYVGAKTSAKGNTRNSYLSELPFKERYQLMHDSLKDGFHKDNAYFSYLQNARAVIIVTSKLQASMLHKDFYRGDVCIAITHGILAAKALGLASCWMGLLQIALNKDKGMRSALGIKEGERVDGAVALGYSELKWEQAPPRGPVNVIWL